MSSGFVGMTGGFGHSTKVVDNCRMSSKKCVFTGYTALYYIFYKEYIYIYSCNVGRAWTSRLYSLLNIVWLGIWVCKKRGGYIFGNGSRL